MGKNLQETLENVKKNLERYNQSHLLAFWDRLAEDSRKALLDQINALDLAKIDEWVRKYVMNPVPFKVPGDLIPAHAYPAVPVDERQQQLYDEARQLGRQLISDGKVAAFVVAGGQGTRLGFDGPKGNFPISPVKNKTLFRIFAETIKAVSKKYNAVCPWYIMTSPLNYGQTIEVFRSNNYYGLQPENVFIFQQGTLPNFSFDGKILLAAPDRIASSPDGHGGSLKALYASGAVEDMKVRGVEYVSYFQVDNGLINIFDPLFIGLHAMEGAEMSSKALIKAYPKEPIGNFCLVDGKVTVIEYSDLPDVLAEQRKPDGSLFFQLGSIAIHIISTRFIEKLNSKGFGLPLHKAVKKIACIDKDGNLIKPDRPNGVKLESFVFDALPLASKSVILETLREEEFAPTKNATGGDSPESARQLMVARAANWLEAAGVKVGRKPDGQPDAVIEIAPSFAVEKSDVKEKAASIPPIKPGGSCYLE